MSFPENISKLIRGIKYVMYFVKSIYVDVRMSAPSGHIPTCHVCCHPVAKCGNHILMPSFPMDATEKWYNEVQIFNHVQQKQNKTKNMLTCACNWHNTKWIPVDYYMMVSNMTFHKDNKDPKVCQLRHLYVSGHWYFHSLWGWKTSIHLFVCMRVCVCIHSAYNMDEARS